MVQTNLQFSASNVAKSIQFSLEINLVLVIVVVKLQSSLTVQSKSVGLGVDFVFPL